MHFEPTARKNQKPTKTKLKSRIKRLFFPKTKELKKFSIDAHSKEYCFCYKEDSCIKTNNSKET